MTTKKRASAEVRASAAWKSIYHSPEGKAAIGMLFKDFGFFDTPMGDNNALIRSIGQRDVLVRISQLIGMKPDKAPDEDAEHQDFIDKMLRTTTI